MASCEVLLFLDAAAPVNDVGQDLLKLGARHSFLPKGIRVDMFLPTVVISASVIIKSFGTSAVGFHASPARCPLHPVVDRLVAFLSAWLSFRRSRSFIRALWSCDLLLPMEQPI